MFDLILFRHCKYNKILRENHSFSMFLHRLLVFAIVNFFSFNHAHGYVEHHNGNTCHPHGKRQQCNANGSDAIHTLALAKYIMKQYHQRAVKHSADDVKCNKHCHKYRILYFSKINSSLGVTKRRVESARIVRSMVLPSAYAFIMAICSLTFIVVFFLFVIFI